MLSQEIIENKTSLSLLFLFDSYKKETASCMQLSYYVFQLDILTFVNYQHTQNSSDA